MRTGNKATSSIVRALVCGTKTARGRCQIPPHLLVAGDGNSCDPSPVRLRQEAKRGDGGGGGAIGGEIVPQPPSHVFFNTARPEGHQISEMRQELEEEVRLPKGS